MVALASLLEVPSATVLIKKSIRRQKFAEFGSAGYICPWGSKLKNLYRFLVRHSETDPDYGIRADAAGALGYLERLQGAEPLVRAFL